eukprot:CAMPEP_0113439596 /NCGR_PEP_ID=MMETSP0014_2-20120614/120_1 /TAXON_ID=2857 /ORGANISM="Nitzschia sp." /LENGTH=1044 /DNA_ID=CAMNT_0000330357 /DNA_START=121 /DNA_END=3255 /DNA_ORIENTATION=- /assembly_acc=CAM_ASM_000159
MVTVMIRSSDSQHVHTILAFVVCFLSFSSIGPVTSFHHSVIHNHNHNHNHRHQQPLLLWDGRRRHLTSKQTAILYVVPLTENDNKIKNQRRQRQKSARSSTTSSSEDTTSDNKVDTDKDSSSSTNSPDDDGNDNNSSKAAQPLLDWTSSGTIGSLLMQMQRKEEEMRKLNKTLLDEQEFLDLSPSSSNLSGGSNTTTVTSATKDGDKSTAEQQTTTTKGRQQRFRLRRKQQQKNQKRVPKQDELVSLIQQVQQQQGGSGGGGDGDDGPDKADDGSSEQGSDDGEDLVFSPMDADTAKELDDAVSIRISSSLKDVAIVDLPELYQILRESSRPGDDEDTDSAGTASNVDRTTAVSTTKEEESEEDLPLLSRKEHYEDRIGRDLRLLAVSIASSVDSVDEWRVYCQQSTGGIMPLVECIRVGARSIRQGGELKQQPGFDDLGSGPISGRKEECFLAAVSTCRALRDLCALSLELGAVITDDLLRANIASRSKGDPSLMDDLCTLLCYADDLGDITPKRRKQRLLSLRRRRAEGKSPKLPHLGLPHRPRKETRLQCKLYVTQLLLAMACASDSAVDAIRNTEGLQEVLLSSSSYARKEQRRRWLRYPGEIIKYVYRTSRVVSRKSATQQSNADQVRRPFIEAASLTNDMKGRIQGVANQVLAAIGYNQWVPKVPGQKGLRILCLDGGGSRGMTAVVAMKCLVGAVGGVEVSDCFDLVVGTSTGAIIAFLVGLNLETSEQAIERYDVLIQRIFTKSAFSTPMMLFTTASYDEAPFMTVLSEILGDQTMLDSRANPAVPFVFAVTSKMSSTPSSVALFRNYNYNGGELPDPFIIKPKDARNCIGLPIADEASEIRLNNYVDKPEQTVKRRDGSRHPGSFRVLQRYALRATTAAPTVFKPVLMGGEMYCDGGIVASNPSAIAIHEARNIFPDVPVELVVSLGTGGFIEQKAEPRIGWDGIIGQIVNSATDAEQVHHILEDVLGDGGTAQLGRSSVSNTQYMRFNPTLGLPDEFPIDVTDKDKLEKIKQITRAYMAEPEQQRKLNDLAKSL